MRTKSFQLILLLTLVFHLGVQGQSTVPSTGRNGMVATAHPLASAAALDMLRSGGNAVDAAVAAAFTIGVVEPDGSGLGGGGGMVIYLKKEQRSYFVNYYGRSSENASGADFKSGRDNYTAKAIEVPGTVAGLLLAHEKFGSLPLKKILEPAIRHAENGFPVDGTLAKLILDNTENIMSDSVTASIFLEDGFPRMEGEKLVQKDLATVLKTIAENGRDGFYEGKLAAAFVKGIRERGGVLTENDFSSYQAEITSPVTGNYRGYDILTANLPQSGISLIQGLNMLENYDLKASGHFSESARTLHIIAEVEKLVYADRYQFVGDPDFVTVPLTGLASKEYARVRFNSINQSKLDPPNYREATYGNPAEFNYDLKKEPVHEMESAGGHTTHLSVIDKDGNAVALTQTLGLFFGSVQTVAGVLFNNAMTNFSYNVENVNYLQNSKRCRSSITPTIILKNGSPYLILGSPGASRIITTLIELVVNVIDFGMDVNEANMAPRFYCQKFEDFLHVESGIKPEVRSELEKMGHKIKVYEGIDLFFGGAQMIYVDAVTGEYSGSADKRRGGIAIGY
ncbi:MAG TPA: gamma-glutamyltransferase [Bacteroidales bacterium]|nr:gamma-glutamyltransferase [Bacteroidales bacterium]